MSQAVARVFLFALRTGMLNAFTLIAAASNSAAAAINASGAQCVGVALMYGQTNRLGFANPSGCP